MCVCVCVCVHICVSFFSFSMRYFDQAAVFLESCLEYGLIKRNEETSTDTIYHPLIFSLHSLPSFFSTPLLSYLSTHPLIGPLIEAVFLEYARYLDNLGLKRGMRYYCNLAGEKGQQLMEEYFSPHRRHHN